MNKRKTTSVNTRRLQQRRIQEEADSEALAVALAVAEEADQVEAYQAEADSESLAEALQLAEDAHQAEADSESLAEALQVADAYDLYSEDESPSESQRRECAICYDDIFIHDAGCPAQNCPAVFHRACIDRWLNEGRRNCAMCQLPV